MSKNIIRTGLTALGAALLLSAPQAMAQPSAAPQQAQPGQQQAQTFDDAQVERFADSFSEIMEIREHFSAQLQDADDAETAHELQQQANEKMIDVIENNDLSVTEYNAIAQAMQTDPELRDRVLALLE